MKNLEEIVWGTSYKGREREEYHLYESSKNIALCNGDFVPQDFIEYQDQLQILVWEEKITEKQMEEEIFKSLK